MRMQKWTRPENYGGAEWNNYYIFLSQNRDSDVLTRSNFRSALTAIGGETGFEENENGNKYALITVVRENHWACGWVEWIAIHESATEQIAIAERILERLEDYPIVNENDFGELEYEECAETWKNMSVSERSYYLRRHSHTCSCIRNMFEAVRGGSWRAAANMLHCPADLIY